MQIYVDEIPKNCNDCKFQVFVAHHQHGWQHHERFCSIMKDNYDCKCSKEHCPLKSLAEHDKQVRKEVCEEIGDKMNFYGSKTIYSPKGDAVGDHETLSLNEVNNILNQVQGEIK